MRGSPTNGTPTAGPYQLKAASNKTTIPGSGREGELTATYDAAGNLSALSVKRLGPCLPTGGQCTQLFFYAWDEVGRLVRARRWDLLSSQYQPPPPDPLPATPAADLSYRYDASDQRVLKTATDAAGIQSHTVYVFDTLELRRASFASGDYTRNEWTEVPYLSANGVRLARVAYEPSAAPAISGKQQHVFLELGDHLGSTSVVLDQATEELVERSTTMAYGAAESDYRPEPWEGFREDYKFTGKEEDAEVGLGYFGKRFLSTNLTRWVSADPLGTHFPRETDPNIYGYVVGKLLQSTDPLGLTPPGSGGTGGASSTAGTSGPGNAPAPPPLPGSQHVDILVAPGAAEGNGHMAVLVETPDKGVLYVSQHPRDDLSTGSLVSQAVTGRTSPGWMNVQYQYEEDDITMQTRPLTMDEVRSQAKNGLYGYQYTESVTIMANPGDAQQMAKNAETSARQYNSGDKGYNIVYNNCTDAVQDVVQTETSVSLPMDWDPRPNAYFEKLTSESSQSSSPAPSPESNESPAPSQSSTSNQ